MRCFIHAEKEATAVCRKCGKGMCIDCSSFGSHKGVCPVCYLSLLNRKRARCIISSIIFSIILAIVSFLWVNLGIKLYAYDIVSILIVVVMSFNALLILLKILRIVFLSITINKIDRALKQGTGKV